jgi:hypothetical protein
MERLGLKKGGKVEVEVEVETKQRGGPVSHGHMKRSMPHLSTYEAVEGKGPHRHLKKGGSVSMRKVAHEEVMKHVNKPAPTGHKGQRKC